MKMQNTKMIICRSKSISKTVKVSLKATASSSVQSSHQTELQLIAKGVELLQALVKSLDRSVAAAAKPRDRKENNKRVKRQRKHKPEEASLCPPSSHLHAVVKRRVVS